MVKKGISGMNRILIITYSGVVGGRRKEVDFLNFTMKAWGCTSIMGFSKQLGIGCLDICHYLPLCLQTEAGLLFIHPVLFQYKYPDGKQRVKNKESLWES